MNEESLFEEAWKLPPAERARLLDAKCQGEPELRAAVESLLAAHDQPENPLDRPPYDPGVTLENSPESPAAAANEAVAADVGVRGGFDSSDAPRDEPAPTQVIAGRYVLQERLGVGGMGEVWVAKQTEPVKRRVALKLIKPGMDSRAVLSRFEQERQALALMDHPNIAKVLDGGVTADRRPYFAMELVNGLPLTSFCDEAKLGIRQRLELFTAICNAVQHAHQKGIIHRDLKPSNVLVTLIDGRPVPKIIDFGVAKAVAGRLADESFSTQFGAVIGTLEYMSPEQAGYSGEDIDTRSDIYSLGVVLYELLTGLRPIDAARLRRAAFTELIRIIREEDPARPSTRLSTDKSLPSLAAVRQLEPRRLMTLLRGELDWVVMKCLEKQRDRRYESAGALGRDIARYLSDEPVEARPPSAAYRVRKYLSRHGGRVVVAGLLATAIVALLVAGYVTSKYSEAERQRQQVAEGKQVAEDARLESERQEKLAIAAAHDAAQSKEQVREVLYAADIQLASHHWSANQLDKMRDVLRRHLPEAGDTDQRGFEWHYLWGLANASQRTLRGHAQPIASLAFSGASTTLLSGDVEYRYSQPGTLRRWRLDDGDEPFAMYTQVASPELPGYYPGVRSLAPSADGTRCALVEERFARILDTRTGEQVQVIDAAGARFRAVAFSPDGAQLAIGDREGEITLWDARTGELNKRLGKHQLSVLCLEFSPDGKLLAAGGGDESAPTWSELLHGELRLWNVDDAQQVGQCAAVRSQLQGLSFHPRGLSVAAATMEGTVVLWNTTRLDESRILRGHTGTVNAVCWLADGRFLASGGEDGVVRVWDVERDQGHHVYKGHAGAVTALATTADGRLLASGGSDALIQVWDPQVDPTRTIVRDLPWAIGTVEFSGDGHSLAIGTYTQVTVCDTERLQERRELPIDHWVFATAISGDGTLVATAGNQGEDGEEPGVVKLWDVATQAVCFTLDPVLDSGQHVRFSPNGKSLACSGRAGPRDSGQFAVSLFDVQQGRRLWRLPDATTFDYSPDGTRMALAGRGGCWTTHLDDGSASHKLLLARPFQEVKFSPNGRELALVDAEGQLSLYSLDDGEETPLGRATRGLAFSPDGRRLAALDPAALHVWDADSLRLLASCPIVAPHFLFTPDGRTIVTAGREIQLWQADTGRELLNLGAYTTSGVNSLAISSDGTRLAVGGGYRDEHEGVWVWLAPRTDESPK